MPSHARPFVHSAATIASIGLSIAFVVGIIKQAKQSQKVERLRLFGDGVSPPENQSKLYNTTTMGEKKAEHPL